MDDGSDSNLWQRLRKIVKGNTSEPVVKAIDEASKDGELDQNERLMLLNVLQLNDIQVQEIMIPRTDIICANNESTVNEVIALIVSSGHSRIPLYKDNRDDFIGVVHAKDLLPSCFNPENMNTLANKYMRPISYVPETKKVLELLHEFQMKKNHMVSVLDEFGGITGLVTIEDILEEIVGEIEDEYDAPKQADIIAKSDGSFILAGRADLDDVNEHLLTNIEAEEVDTIGGFLALIAGHVPKQAEAFIIEEWKFTVLEADAKQVYYITATTTAPSKITGEEAVVNSKH